jgi:peptidoglycan/xylan/chitin deacetylase (PgdA/CDA1 family)
MAISTRFDLSPNDIKRRVARVLDLVGVNQLGLSLQKLILRPFIRAVNYHEIRQDEIAKFEEHLAYFRDHYTPVDLDSLQSFVTSGEWAGPKPGLILSFDDGHRSHFDLAAPLLEKYGFKGWFFVPIGLMAIGDTAQDADRANALTLEQLRYLRERHIVGSHTITHRRLSSAVPLETLEEEIVGSQAMFSDILGGPVRCFCWVGGEEENYSREAADLIRGIYDFSFMTNKNPLWLVRFQLSGLMDLLYLSKRRRVNRLTA